MFRHSEHDSRIISVLVNLADHPQRGRHPHAALAIARPTADRSGASCTSAQATVWRTSRKSPRTEKGPLFLFAVESLLYGSRVRRVFTLLLTGQHRKSVI
jgi:hypothetical protein